MADVGSTWMPAKQPKSAAQLRLVAEDLYTVATAESSWGHTGFGKRCRTRGSSGTVLTAFMGWLTCWAIARASRRPWS